MDKANVEAHLGIALRGTHGTWGYTGFGHLQEIVLRYGTNQKVEAISLIAESGVEFDSAGEVITLDAPPSPP